jgi:hypothetical protein
MKLLSYELSIVSDPMYERLIAELVFNDGSIVVSQERDISTFEASFYSGHRSSADLINEPNLVDLEVFLGAIAEAKARLQLLDIPSTPAH